MEPVECFFPCLFFWLFSHHHTGADREAKIARRGGGFRIAVAAQSSPPALRRFDCRRAADIAPHTLPAVGTLILTATAIAPSPSDRVFLS